MGYRVKTGNSGGGGGGVPTVQMGPDFGEGGNVDQTYNTECALSLGDVNLETSLGVQSFIAVESINLETSLASSVSLSLGDVTLETSLASAVAFEDPIFFIDSYICSKDLWADTVALCPTDTNHNLTDIQVSGTAGSTKDGYISFDLSGFPANANVLSAEIKINVKTAPLTSQTIKIVQITNGSESWSETTMKCSDRPAAAGTALTSFASGTTSGVDISITANAAIISRIDNRMSNDSCTFLLQNAAANLLQTVFESRNEGTNNPLGARLVLTFSTPK
jgi:hypothetical protein